MSTKPLLSLSELQSELDQWRTHRQPRHIPEWIRAEAVRLLSKHRPCKIKQALNINHRTLKQWKAQYPESSQEEFEWNRSPFISLPPVESAISDPTLRSSSLSSFKLVRQDRDGSSLWLEGELSLEHWSQVLAWLTAEERVR